MKLMQRLVVVVSLCSVFYTQSGGYYIIDYDIAVATNAPLSDEFKFGAAAVGVGLAAWFLYDCCMAYSDISMLKEAKNKLEGMHATKNEFFAKNNNNGICAYETIIGQAFMPKPTAPQLSTQIQYSALCNLEQSCQRLATSQEVHSYECLSLHQFSQVDNPDCIRPVSLSLFRRIARGKIEKLNTEVTSLKTPGLSVWYALSKSWNSVAGLYQKYKKSLDGKKIISQSEEEARIAFPLDDIILAAGQKGGRVVLKTGKVLESQQEWIDAEVKSSLCQGDISSQNIKGSYESERKLKDIFSKASLVIRKFIEDFGKMSLFVTRTKEYQSQYNEQEVADREQQKAEAELLKAQAENRKAYAQQQESAAASNAYNARARRDQAETAYTAERLTPLGFLLWLIFG